MTMRNYGEPLLNKPSHSRVLYQFCTPTAARTHETSRFHRGQPLVKGQLLFPNHRAPTTFYPVPSLIL